MIKLTRFDGGLDRGPAFINPFNVKVIYPERYYNIGCFIGFVGEDDEDSTLRVKEDAEEVSTTIAMWLEK